MIATVSTTLVFSRALYEHPFSSSSRALCVGPEAHLMFMNSSALILKLSVDDYSLFAASMCLHLVATLSRDLSPTLPLRIKQTTHTHIALYPCLLWDGGKTSSVVLETRGF